MEKHEKIMKQFEKLSQDEKDRIVKHYLERLEQEANDIKTENNCWLFQTKINLQKNFKNVLFNVVLTTLKKLEI